PHVIVPHRYNSNKGNDQNHRQTANISSRCDVACRCLCHSAQSYHRWKTTLFRAVLGSLSICSGGFPLKHVACTDSGCRRQFGSSWIRFDYRFPDWLPRVALSVYAASPGPEMLIRIVRRLPFDVITKSQSIFGCVHSRDIDGIKGLLKSGMASVHDVRAFDGQTPLGTALEIENVEIARFLLDAESDPFQPCAVSEMFRWFHTRSQKSRQAAELFPLSTLLDDWEYSYLHKILLGVLPLDLERSLENPDIASQLDQQTIDGYTAAHLAAACGNTDALQVLKDHGADMGCLTARGTNLLHEACRTGNISSIKFLLGAGVALNGTTIHGHTPLHYAARCVDDPAVISLLLESGADHKVRDMLGSVAFDHASSLRPNLIDCFLSHGTDVNSQDFDGNTILHDSIHRNVHKAAQTLLSRGANYRTVNNHGQGVLHILAQKADLQTFQIFTDFGLVGLNKGFRDRDGRTASELFEKRQGISSEIRYCFQKLLDSVIEGGE
ncbi:ankyrin repeat-containing domain protein, partial [Whalleya microplaca]